MPADTAPELRFGVAKEQLTGLASLALAAGLVKYLGLVEASARRVRVKQHRFGCRDKQMLLAVRVVARGVKLEPAPVQKGLPSSSPRRDAITSRSSVRHPLCLVWRCTSTTIDTAKCRIARAFSSLFRPGQSALQFPRVATRRRQVDPFRCQSRGRSRCSRREPGRARTIAREPIHPVGRFRGERRIPIL